jgi:ATP-binding cassette subfamily B protein
MFGAGGMGGMGGMGRPPGGGPHGGGGPIAGIHGALTRSTDLSDEIIFGKVYDHKVVTRLAAYLKTHKAGMVVAFIAMVFNILTSLYMPLLFSDAVNVITGNADKQEILLTWIIRQFGIQGNANILLAIFIVFIANGMISWGSQYFQIYTMSNIGRKVLLTLRMQMFAHLQKLSLSFYDRNEVGRVMSRVQNDVASLQEVISNGVLEIFADFLSLGIIIFVIFTMNVQLSLITLTIIPVLLIIMMVWQKYARTAFMKVRQAISVVNADLQENISGARVIQSLSREKVNFQRFDNLNEANLDANLQATRLSAGLQPIVELLTGASIALVIIFGGMQAIDGKLLLGPFIAFVLYVQRFFDPIRSLSMQYTELQRAMAGGQRIFEVLDTPIEVVDAPDADELPLIEGSISYEHVSFSYIEGIDVLKEINLQIHPGETIAFVGATGAGKSTMVALVCRFYEITGGSLKIDGHDVRKVTQDSLRRQIGVVLQEPFLFSGTVRENIMYGRDGATEEKMIKAAEAVGAHKFIMRLENGYDTILQERGSNLSQGQRQLISFARAILADPRILILDEATANIDTQTEIIIQQALKQLLKGRTSLVIAHRLSTIHDANRVVVMENGKIVEIGSHDELIQIEGTYRHLYTMAYANPDTDAPQTQKRHST